MNSNAGFYAVGLLLLAASVLLLRMRGLPGFVEQLAVPVLLVGGGCLSFAVLRDLSVQAGTLLLALVVLGVTTALTQIWLRSLLGALSAVLVGIALTTHPAVWISRGGLDLRGPWLACHGLVLIWAAAMWAQGKMRQGSAWLECVASGWLLTTLGGLGLMTGMTFLAGGVVPGDAFGRLATQVTVERAGRGFSWFTSASSAFLACAAAAWIARAWPSLRQPAFWAAAVVLSALCGLMPTLGAVLLLLAGCASTRRWYLVTAAALSAAWIIGAFYYRLDWPLASKAAALVAAGAVLGVLSATLRRKAGRSPSAASVQQGPRTHFAALWVGLATLASLGVASAAIWQKQALIESGRKVFVELAPVDPRSLMQGDYMQLNFRLPSHSATTSFYPQVVARRDERGVATLLRMREIGSGLAADEFVIKLTVKNGGLMLVTDAWFFREGEAQRWARAKYGEFRVAPDGQALLVGMADAELKPIPP